jgi:hypothetical protein
MNTTTVETILIPNWTSVMYEEYNSCDMFTELLPLRFSVYELLQQLLSCEKTQNKSLFSLIT